MFRIWSFIVRIVELPILIYVNWTRFNAMPKVSVQLLFITVLLSSIVWLQPLVWFVSYLTVRAKETFRPSAHILPVTYTTRRFFCLSILDDPIKDYRLSVPGNFHSLDHFLCSWHVSAINIWNILPPFMLTGVIKWWHIMRLLQHHIIETAN